MNTQLLLASAIAALAAPTLAHAFTPGTPEPAPTAFKTEQCYGIAKAGQNDCASTASHSCAGLSKINADPLSWVYVPAGYCERIVGGSKTPKA